VKTLKFKDLKNFKDFKDFKNLKEIRLPELEIQEKWKRIMDKVNNIRHMYWIIIIAALLAVFISVVPKYLWSHIWAGVEGDGLLVGLVFFFSFVAISFLWTAGQKIDVGVFMLLNMRGRRPSWLDWLMLYFTQLGNFVFALFVALLIYFGKNQLLAYELVLGILTLGLIVQMLKVSFHRIRPYVKLQNIRIIGSRAKGRSFPSGHTSQAFFMATLLTHSYNADVMAWSFVYALALLVGVTRIYVGMHYPRDVIAGALLGSAWGLVGMIVNNTIA